ncbi:lipopolysaccharide biosynthesis protein [Kordiimonas lacus]|uniref:Membrane protein involved in the export of O-antigen and teichoic acid n=2 Tax=Kordiimonas lacus TaxID=637679 RepID=A0A1G6TC46_9PROT|nr:oligosaccharide flippase family protein [Kordiimonas lacus]SDD26599.1 Membrane protein involved in the export of O-antigen and teichoic acid [Kordiimonas lacus]
MSIFKNLSALLGGRGFVRNVSILLAGTLGAHLITVAGIPITARLFGPEAFSVLAVYSAILSILLTLATLNLHLGIPIADTHRHALALAVGSGLVLMTLTLNLWLVLLFADNWIVSALNLPDFSPYLMLLVPGFLLGGTYALLQMWFSRQKQFGLIAKTRITRSAGGTGTQLVFGTASNGPIGLVLGHIVYNGMGAFGMLRRLLRDEGVNLKTLTRTELRDSLYNNKKYAFYTTPENLANVAAIQIPILAIAATPAAGQVGQLYLAQNIMMLPMMLIGSSVGQVFVAEAPRYSQEKRLWQFTLSVLRGLAITGVPLLLLLALLAPFLAGPILGREWIYTGELIVWMTPWIVLQFLSSPLSTIFYVTGNQLYAMLIQFFGLGLRVGAVLLSISLAPTWAMQVYALSGAAFYLIMLLAILIIARKLQ